LQDHVDSVYRDTERWNRMSIASVAGSGFFSSDRTIQEYATRVWKCAPCKVPEGLVSPRAVMQSLDSARAAP